MGDDLDQALSAVGPRLRVLRREREITLADLSARTGVSVSTLSRLESGDRRPTLELLFPLTQRAGGIQAYKLVIPVGGRGGDPQDLKTHEGYEWVYVLNGRLRLRL